LLAVIPVGLKPQEMSLSLNRPYLFVTCIEDDEFGANHKGSVAVINYNTLSIVVPGGIYSGFQPHGIAVDDDNDLVYVANLNFDDDGPAPHHSSDCGGRNGYMSIIDMKTLQLLTISTPDGITYTYQNELIAYPYSVAFRK
jgi:DNA-binding beta-propeller fold protein YncE